ncbi:MAG TPA: TlpA family protein disulfide reductase [Candidatus Sphingobacterium stercoripullorum]|uniref:TlpA family protein disulfide reductase n=1 Tax=Candidatus Sphingobacterium stercoripullorum TaxID=2838759 RepID=A0A9D2AZ65_9SPHI|nr:TlpA family protein disulfide reductase [Candidatus Sphingobacterium stercoripullorum]
MRKIVYYLTFAALIVAQGVNAQQSKTITVKGKVKFPPNQEHQEKFPFVLKDKGGADAEVLQKINLKEDGTYEIKIPIEKPRLYSLDVFGWDRITFWGGSDDLKINFRGEDTAKIKIKNPPYVFIESEGKENQLINMLNWENYQNYQNVIAIGKLQYQAMQNKDSVMNAKLMEMMNEQYANMSVRIKRYVETFKNDPQVVYALRMVSPKRDQDFIMEHVDPLIEKYPWLAEAKEIKENVNKELAAAKKSDIGSKFIDIKQETPEGEELSLYDVLKGKKYVLVDYWASWCGPCRSENPKIVEVYNKYKDQGFDVYAVSLDDKKERWLQAIEADKLPWHQVSDLKGWKNEASQYYNITAIPSNFLIDEEGKIVAKNLRGDALEKELDKLYSGKKTGGMMMMSPM